MAATTTRSIRSIVEQLQSLNPEFAFSAGEDFSWIPTKNLVTYDPDGTAEALLHETGHALSTHIQFSRDIELIDMERDAWSVARKLAGQLSVKLDEAIISDHLDTYRDWLHARSSCINCSQTGIEISKHHYRCIVCQSEWRVNDARTCRLKRTKIIA